jgi:hypothetical protein
MEKFERPIADYRDWSSVANGRYSLDGLQHLGRPPGNAAPAERATISEERCGGCVSVEIFNLDPIVYEISSLLSIGHPLDSINRNCAFGALKLDRVRTNRELSHVFVCKQSESQPGVLS